MCANDLNLWTVATLIMFAGKVLGIGPELNWLTIFTPWVIGEGIYQTCNVVMWRMHVAARKAAKAEAMEQMARLNQVLGGVSRGDHER